MPWRLSKALSVIPQAGQARQGGRAPVEVRRSLADQLMKNAGGCILYTHCNPSAPHFQNQVERRFGRTPKVGEPCLPEYFGQTCLARLCTEDEVPAFRNRMCADKVVDAA